ncbi:thiamine pyrophosphate-dependent enzyme [Amylibacter sp. IMCC11727]|uniref:thiamine pyrophosphate-dependent enzyme n=1 Tax=Amylibacter sp. IMCC11727 TaxID=3039851 RepID=UPI00244DDCE7|nr:thiamine pyrophosphate-dependent enzyme [Amylibacter sp. IMCC11727]WGI20388.1 thiamine pyrophosphate-binding protein [Amylibacter sp. IMCC11727]
MTRTGGELLVKCLLEQGVDTAFGIPGESYLAVLDALYDVQNQLKLITTRHESGASFAAEAYGKLTGQPGICFVTRGPGATNASIGVHTAMQNSSPMILFVGQIGRDMRDREAFQEVDYRAFFGKMAKWVTEIDNPDRIPEIVARAFQMATSGRPGPVVVSLPEDMLTDTTDATPCRPIKPFRPAPDPAAVQDAADLLNSAKSPIMVVGGGGWTEASRNALNAFAQKTNIPVATVFRSQDLIDNRGPHFIGDASFGMPPHLRDALTNADVILAVNIRFGEILTDGWTILDVPNPKQQIIHCHRSADEINKIYQADVAIQSEQELFLKALNELVSIDCSENLKQIKAAHETVLSPKPAKGAVDMAPICAHLRDVLDDDVIITNGAGNFSIWSGRFLKFHKNQRLLGPQAGAMGAGLPAAIAAKAVHPNRQVVCFAGDGDFQMSSQELGTMLQNGLQPIILVLNNGLYGTIRLHQDRRYVGRPSGTEIVNPDFVQLAKAYGFWGTRIEKTEDFAEAFATATTKPNGALIELIIDPADIAPNVILES